MKAMNANEDGVVVGYMCGTDWSCELGAASDGNKVYPSVGALMEERKCTDECGIVEVEVKFRRVVRESKI